MIKFENKSNGRFYYLKIESDMLNECILRIFFGGQNISRVRTVSYDSKDAIQKEIERLSKRRIKRGYEIVT